MDFDIFASLSVTAPTSFISSKMGLITAPRLGVKVEKRFGDIATIDLGMYGEHYFQRYSTMEGGNPNPMNRFGATLDGELKMPFYKAVSVGAGLYSGYTWYFNPGTPPPGGVYQGAVQSPQQPTQQAYGGEIFAKYYFPIPDSWRVGGDFTVAFAQGDPSLGYTSRLHDGVSHLYLFYRQTSEVYAALSLHY
jgi:hypothetical protein